MFDLIAMSVSPLFTFAFPVFASYKALNTSDPILLKPWLMYWVVLACVLLVESWFSWILFWIPLYGWARTFFLLWLIAPQTQGAKVLYTEHIAPFLTEHERQIDEFIASAHDRAKTAGWDYLKRAVQFVKEQALGFPPSAQSAASAQAARPAPPSANSYVATLLGRFNLPSARVPSVGSATGAAGSAASAAGSATSDFYNLLANAVSAYAIGSSGAGRCATAEGPAPEIVPREMQGVERASFISAQRERLTFLLGLLDREAARDASPAGTPAAQAHGAGLTPPSTATSTGVSLGIAPESRSLSTGSLGDLALSKSVSGSDFEKVDVDEEARRVARDEERIQRLQVQRSSSGAGWMPWVWGARNPTERLEEKVAAEGGEGEGERKKDL